MTPPSTRESTEPRTGWCSDPTCPMSRTIEDDLQRLAKEIAKDWNGPGAEVRAALLVAIREEVTERMEQHITGTTGPRHWVPLDAVLALLDTLSDGGPTDG